MAEQFSGPIGQLAEAPLPPLRHAPLTDTEAPDTYGSFFVEDIVEGYYPNYVDARPHAPTDEETGVPLPIAPYLAMDSLSPDARNMHHSVYPHNSPKLKSLGGSAFRVARLQIVPNWLHNGSSPTAFHNIYGNGVSIPETEDELAGAVAILVAGYVPELAVDTTDGTDKIRPLTREEREFLTRIVAPSKLSRASVERYRKVAMPEGATARATFRRLQIQNRTSAEQKYQTVYYGTNEVAQFLRNFVIRQDPSMLNRRLMNKFLKSGSPDYGMTLLGHAAAIAVESATVCGKEFRNVYNELRSRKLINMKMPPYASDFLLTRLGSRVGRLGLMEDFHHQLEESRVQTAS